MAEAPTPIRLSKKLADKIREVQEITGQSQQEIMRVAMEIGLEDLRRANYDIAAAVVDKAEEAAKKHFKQTGQESLVAAASLLAEESPSYRTPTRKKAG